jgi:DNA polymerase elongation subunit (family B)
MVVEGWLFDVYPHRDGMVVWVLDAGGRSHRLLHRYRPVMYMAGPRRAIEAAGRAVATLGVPVGLRPTRQRELMTGEEVPVVRVAVGSPVAYPAAAQRLAHVEHLTLYNCDVPVGRLFFYETGLFPLAHCRIEHTGGVIRAIQVQGGSEDLEYDLPPLTTLRLRLVPAFSGDASVSPAHGRRGLIEIGVDGEVVVVDGDDPAECLHSLNRMLARYDPDVILTEWGDAFLLPQLRALAVRAGLPLHLNRDTGSTVRTRRSRSYVTYGQVVYQAGAQMLRGRWHIDLRNSFIYSESEMAGLLEIARLARIPVQDLARTSTGTAISSMQLNQAVRDGVLIPWRKSEPEGFKTAAQLIVTDKGGLTYQPLVGAYESVGELDFSSMYPTMMAKFNISPETIGCSCCPDSRIPEINYTVCRKRKGLVPLVLDHLLKRRMYYKERKKETAGEKRVPYDQRQTALKWCLVTCLDGDTLVPVRSEGYIQAKPIREIIDAYLPDGPGIVPAGDLYAFGYDRNLRPLENPVKNVIKAPAPPSLLRVRLQAGRELRMIPGHRCFVLVDGRLVEKRAAELREGDLVPVTSGFPVARVPIKTINVALSLLESLPSEERRSWRVFGDALKERVAEAYREIHLIHGLEIVREGVHLVREHGWLSRKHRITLKRRLKREASQRHLSQKGVTYGPFVCLSIRSIEDVSPSSSYVYCFEVEEDLRGFIVSGGIFTGNSFGYLGYRNARFGRIEAHESVTAYSREKLLQAKEIAEARGYRMLHALVDSMWLQRPGATREDYETLAREVSETTELPIFVEGVYRWLTFLPSKTHRSVGVPNRYMGVFDDGSAKVRGIEVRRSDVPGIVETTQQGMLRRMFRCTTLAEVQATLPEILGILEEALVRLRAGEVIPEELVITTHLSQEVDDYQHNTVQAITARSLDRHGAQLHPGEAIQYIITDRRAHLPDDRVRPYTLLGSDWNYDAEAYADMLLRAGETILELFGWTKGRLREQLWSRRVID